MNPTAVGRVLLVEDDPDHAELVTRALDEAAPGLDVRWVWDGESALDELARLLPSPDRPVLVMLDLRLPGMDGGEVLGRIRADPRMADVPVVILTTAEPADSPHGGEDSRTRRVVKPIDGGSFRRLIVELVGGWLGQGQQLHGGAAGGTSTASAGRAATVPPAGRGD